MVIEYEGKLIKETMFLISHDSMTHARHEKVDRTLLLTSQSLSSP